MAQICIITPTGMKCDSSPIKEHFPGSQACRQVSAKAAQKIGVITVTVDATRRKANRLSVVERVVRLMLAANVQEDSVFTIVKAKP